METLTTHSNATFATSIPAQIMVIGLGGAGGNAIRHMWEMGIEGVNLVACNTDRQDLDKLQIPEDNKIAIGTGLGAGNDPSEGERMAREGLDLIRHMLESRGTKMLFIAAGMGGGTGTGTAPVVASLAREMGILTVAIVTMPPSDEGPLRIEQAKVGLNKLREHLDSLIVLSNDAINELYGDLPLEKAFDNANDVIAFAAKGIAEISTHSNNLVNVDFADVCTVMRNSGRAIMGVASERGDERAEKAVDKVLESPLFGNASITGARNVLINISVSPTSELTAKEAMRVKRRVQEHAKWTDETNREHLTDIIWGTSCKTTLTDDELEVIIVATGFDNNNYNAPDPIVDSTTIKPEEPTPITTIPPTTPPTTIKIATPIAARQVAAPTSIRRPERNHLDIEKCKSVPAYITRKVNLVTATTGRLQKVASIDGEESNPQDDSIQTSMF